MLVSFKVSNFLSFNKEQVLEMYPSRVTSFHDHKYLTKSTQVDILKSAIIYGPNSAGKSKLIEAIALSRNFIVSGSKNKNFIDVPVFRLNGNDSKKSSFIFEISVEGDAFEYGFEIKDSIVIKEWLKKVYRYEEGHLIYERKLHEGKPKVTLTKNISDNLKKLVVNSTKAELKNNQLFLTVINSKNIENVEDVFKRVFEWFSNKLSVIFPNSINHGIQLGIMKRQDMCNFFNKYLNKLDTGIDSLKFHEYELDDEAVTIPKDIKIDMKNQLDEDDKIITVSSGDGFDRYCVERKKNKFLAHKLKAVHINSKGEEIEFDFSEESDGTNRIFNLLPAISMLLNSNKVIIIDEIDRSLHSLIPAKIFEIFFKETVNKDSQLIASTHDINLLDLKKFRRDEIWFVRKNMHKESELYSLEEFKTRFDKELRKSYLSGVYGAIPILD
jgi:uncharacterized protein